MRSEDEPVTVCSACLRACCWKEAFLCDEAVEVGASTVEKTRAELRDLDLEHPSWWDEEAAE